VKQLLLLGIVILSCLIGEVIVPGFLHLLLGLSVYVFVFLLVGGMVVGMYKTWRKISADKD
jgi:hypothetical protein